ncbi:MAG: adenylate/guanylate cyclase domain-containing protein [Undibacterium sp.]|nr:adenylate/guanylate cyclase domain-containing protein [Undibacterium sp.]
MPKQNTLSLDFPPYRRIFSHWRKIRTHIWWLLIASLALGISVVMQWYATQGGFNSADEWLRDHFIQQQASRVEEDRIAVIDIDEASISQLGTWPLSRGQMADLIEKLIAVYGARGVALDIYFPELSKKKDDEKGDMRLAMLAEQAPVALAQVFDFTPARAIAWQFGTPSGGITLSEYLQTQRSPEHRALASGHLANHEHFKLARYTGNIGFVPDADGTLRRIPALVEYQQKAYLPLALSLFRCCGDSDVKASLPAGRMLDSNQAGFTRVSFSRDLSAYRVIPANRVFQETAPIEWLRNKLVIVGSSSLGHPDRVATPLDSSTNGFLVHAEVLSTLLDEQAGIAYQKWPGALLAIGFSLVVVFVGVLMLRQYSAVLSAAMLALASLCWLAVAYFICQHDMWFSPSGPLLSNFFLLAVAVPFAWQSSQQKTRHLLHTLHQYVAKSVVTELLRSDIENPLSPRRLYVTTLIADMAAYTSHVEHLPMEQAATLTRDFLECLTGPVLAQGGTLDKYTGDGLVAFWGAPLPIENHADRALDAAIAMVKNIERFAQLRVEQGLEKIEVRIGIESGIAIAGDFGSSHRSIYTAVGDSVNTASRLEDAARHFPFQIIVGKGTVDIATAHRFTLIGEKMLRGKEKPTLLYTVEIPA